MKTAFLGKTLSGPFTIPSGIVSCSANIIQRVFDTMPEVGVLTSKSIGPQPRLGYREPILTQCQPGSLVNAVGLTNSGAERAAEMMSRLDIPEDRFLLISIFGGSVEEYVAVARLLAPHGDGLELNLSCPHAKGYGMAMGQDPDLVREIVSAVKAAVSIPVVPKLTPNVPNIDEIARAAVAGGADAICAINTMGPETYQAHGHPILSNEKGGVSGKVILPTALRCVEEIQASVDCPVIACGGISSAADVRAFQSAGASIIGIGSALIGMTTNEMADYFKALSKDLETGTEHAEDLVRYDIDMSFKPVSLVSNTHITDDICILTFDRKIDIQAGQFVFLWIPGLGEKPFSALTDDPFSLVIINLGEFTNALMSVEPGIEAYVRGPHGNAVAPPEGARIMAVAGGTGLAAMYQLARDFGNTEIFMGARSEQRLYFIDECEAVSTLHIATDDGSRGHHGVVTELLEQRMSELPANELEQLIFYNCGPAPMVHAAEAVQRKFCKARQIFNAIDYLTKCGVGICGACDAPDGRRLCVDGPFLGAVD
ncbi:MAG: tRNA-dihydrouridine synthase [Gammaproteobacteria bacterium]|nr:tRNA-dihydrouridine synthase [Gammaproteobacteria bacterium]MDP6731294.1 tRNA-dihydrouridine synthase [Gammaproteobacteria bacterium]